MNNVIPKGKVAEYKLAAELLDRGILPCWPSSEAQPYDMIVDVGTAQYRVQVKSTESVADTAAASIEISLRMKTGKQKRRYTTKDTDFIIVHLFATGSWYVFPVQDVTTSVTIRPYNANCKYRKYQNAWALLRQPKPKAKKKKRKLSKKISAGGIIL